MGKKTMAGEEWNDEDQEHFDHFDEDEDGKLSKDEVVKMIEEDQEEYGEDEDSLDGEDEPDEVKQGEKDIVDASLLDGASQKKDRLLLQSWYSSALTVQKMNAAVRPQAFPSMGPAPLGLVGGGLFVVPFLVAVVGCRRRFRGSSNLNEEPLASGVEE